jgi:hypothetical protein
MSVLLVTRLEWAMAMQESGGRVFATRYERGFRRRYIDKLNVDEAEAVFRSTSFGLWQIMGDSLRSLGWREEPRNWKDWCRDPARQLRFMRRKWLMDTDRDDPLWRKVEAWNKGDAGEDRLAEPTAYWRGVETWIGKAPAPDASGLVALQLIGLDAPPG